MLRGKCAVVTGSTGGLGQAIAERLAGEGCCVVLNGIVDSDTMAEEVRHIRSQYGVEVIYDKANLTDPDQIVGMMTRAIDAFGSIDILVNNAVVRHFSSIENFPVERWNEALAVNLSAPFHTIRLALPTMRERGWGRIINIGSVYGTIAAPNRIDYVSTKTALLGMTRAVALETAGTDITCNAICPGTLPTPAILSRIQGIAEEQLISVDDATKEYLGRRQPGGRFISMHAVAAMVAFLCGPDSRDINGAALPVDSGWTAGSL